ncbi:hypothetical protein Pyrfu_1632 [Pyrolobus fumarii 1A]|uniref:Uncharacterized protein n=2 Tax=Pyrolobus fumarii TaxID=54252 RepID=G0ECB9_PYRF1|nr:hypothetical protein Pyrfu_1632 [Pyrolobus fumarii 1A]
MRLTLLLVGSLVVLSILTASFVALRVSAQTWTDVVNLPVGSYNGSGVLLVLISTGVDINDPTIRDALLTVNGTPCFISFDENGVALPPSPPYDLVGIGTLQAQRVVEAAPAVKIVVARVPYDKDPETGLPTVPYKALQAALEWASHPFTYVNGELVECPVSGFHTRIVLIGLPIYNYTISDSIARLLTHLVGSSLVVVPVGDAAPGIFNVLARVEGVVSVAPVPLSYTPIVATLNGRSGGYTLHYPESLYNDIPIEPDYVMPVASPCPTGYLTNVPTCSEEAAAEFAGLAAVVAQMYRDLRAVPPSPYQLEFLIRASVVDLGPASKDTIYGWGLPDAKLAYELLSSNSGFVVCAPSYSDKGFAIAELYTPPSRRYGVVLKPGECVRMWALPSTPYTLTVYGPLGLAPSSIRVQTVSGYWKKVRVPSTLPYPFTISALLLDEKGVALDADVYVLPQNLWPMDARKLAMIMHSMRIEGGSLYATLSCSYLAFASGSGKVYIAIRPDGHLTRIFEVDVATCPRQDLLLGRVYFVESKNVYLVGKGPGAEEDADLLRFMGFRVEVGLTPWSPGTTPDVIVVHPSAARLVWSAAESARGRGLVVMGEAIDEYRRGVSSTYAYPSVTLVASPRYTPGYQPIVKPGAPLATVYGYTEGVATQPSLKLYNITVAPSEAMYVLSYTMTPIGPLVEAFYNPREDTVYIANIWSMWSEGRSLSASITPAGLAVLQLSVAAATGPVSIAVNSSRVSPGDVLSISVWSWRLKVTVWNETYGGQLVRLVSAASQYPGYQLNITVKVGETPYGDYILLANDTLWRLGVATYKVEPIVILGSKLVTAGEELEVRGAGFYANSHITILFDGVAIGSTVSNERGSFYARIPIPGIASPGVHTITAISNDASASDAIEVRVVRTLSIKLAVPSIIPPDEPVQALAVIRLGVNETDANLRAILAGQLLQVERITRGVYMIRIPPLQPGVYTLIVQAVRDERLVYATGLAVAAITVERNVTVATPRHIYELGYNLTRYLDEQLSSIKAGISNVADEVKRVENMLYGLKQDLDAMLDNILATAEKLNSKVDTAKSDVLREVRKVYVEITKLQSTVETTSKNVVDTISSMITQMNNDIKIGIIGVRSAVTRDITRLNYTLATSIALAMRKVDVTTMYTLAALVALSINLAVVGAILVLILRGRR